MRFFFLLWCGFILSSCSSENKKEQSPPLTNPVSLIVPPQTVLAANPITTRIDTCPAAERIIVPIAPTGKTHTLKSGELIKLRPPKTKPADFFVTMQNYNTEQGLALSSVSCGYKDKTGNLWFGTMAGGVSKYDGKSFTNYTTSQGLASNWIWSIMEDKTGNFWFGTEAGGVSKYDGISFTNFTTAEGLVNNSVRSITEDKMGNLWFGTNKGVSKYDGKSFTNFTTAQGLANNVVLSMIKDKAGNLWFGTDGGGVSKYDGKSFTNFTTAQGLANNVVLSMIKDKAGNLWFGTQGGVSKYDGRSFTNFTTSQSLINNNVHSILEDKAGNLWFGTEGGVSKYNGQSLPDDKAGFTSFTTAQGLANNYTWSITEDKTGSLWFGMYGGGISKYDGESFTSFTTSQGLANNNVYGITADKEGNLWFGTYGGGISKYDGKSFTNFTTAQGLMSNYIGSATKDKTENLWFGTLEGVSKYDGKSFTNFTTVQGLANNYVGSITEDKIGNLWFGTQGGGVSKYDGKFFTNFTTSQGLANNYVWSILEDRAGNLWFGTQGGASVYDGKSFTSFTISQGLADNTVWCITEDKRGNLWFGTSGGLSLIKQENLANFFKMPGGGNARLFETYTVVDGLSNDVVTQVAEDKNGNMIIGTNEGLNILKKSNNELHATSCKPVFEIYSIKTGYPVKDINTCQRSLYIDSKGIIWAGTGDKLVRFDYSRIYKNASAPTVFIQAVKINNESMIWYNLSSRFKAENLKLDGITTSPYVVEEVAVFGHILTEAQRDILRKKFEGIQFDGISRFYPVPENLVLPYKHNNITFDFAAIEPARPYLVRYQYILENYDNGWSPVTDKTNATFGNVPEGDYTFKLKAQSPEGVWSDPLCYTFKVLPPWYRTWWAYSMYVFTVMGLLFGLLRWRTTSLRKDKEELEHVVKERTTELVEQKNEAEKQKQKAEKLAKVKDEFLSNMSHEIRTPLNAIIGYTDVNLDEGLPEKIVQNLQAIKLSSDHLHRIVDDILDYSKIESGKFSFHETDFNLEQVLEEIKRLLYFQALKKGNTLTVTVSSAVPVLLYGDREKLMQVLINLVDNAIKFTQEGRIGIDVQLISKEAESVEISFCVSDTGIGIPEDKLETIFESFTQGDNAISRKYGGTGLGLTISKRIIELQGGTIQVCSTEDEGTQFSFRIAYKPGKKSESAKEDKLALKKSLPGLRLLAADDDSVNRNLLGQIVKKWKAEIDFAETPEQLIDLLQRNMYHLVLLDIHMPGMNGFEVAAMIRTRTNTSLKDIPIIALTADVLPATRHKILESGINEYVYKPIDFNALYFKIVWLLNLKPEPVSMPVIEDNKWKIPTEHINLNYLANNYGTNKEEMLELLIQSAGKLNEYTHSLQLACKENNPEEILFSAHKLVTVTEILGIKSIRSELSKIREELSTWQNPGESLFTHVAFINNITQMASKEVQDLIEHINKN